jgi:archaellum component FlaC
MATKKVQKEITLKDIADKFDILSNKFDVFSKQTNKKIEGVDKRFAGVDKKFETVNKKFDQIDVRFKQVDQRFKQVDQRFDLAEKRHKEYTQDAIDTAFRGFQAVVEDTNSRILALEELLHEIQSIKLVTRDVSDTVYNNHSPRITVLEHSVTEIISN